MLLCKRFAVIFLYIFLNYVLCSQTCICSLHCHESDQNSYSNVNRSMRLKSSVDSGISVTNNSGNENCFVVVVFLAPFYTTDLLLIWFQVAAEKCSVMHLSEWQNMFTWKIYIKFVVLLCHCWKKMSIAWAVTMLRSLDLYPDMFFLKIHLFVFTHILLIPVQSSSIKNNSIYKLYFFVKLRMHYVQ